MTTYNLKDRHQTKVDFRYTAVVILRETFFTKKVIKISRRGQMLISANSIVKRGNRKPHVPEELSVKQIEYLENLRMRKKEEMPKKLEIKDELLTLEIANILFSSMFI